MCRFLSPTLLGCLLAFAVVPLALAQNLPNTTRLLRFPTTNGRQIVFCYAGELYTVAKEGGIARRITSGPGYTSFPRFSPDGTQLAFTSQYDGNTEVYVMLAEGGAPKRLTTSATLGRDDISDRMGPNNLVMAWENTKPLVVFRSRMKSFNDFIGQLFTVGLDAELPQQLPVPRGGFVSFSPDDSKMAFNRVFREFRTWKHYRGGMADDIWIYDFKNGTTENLTNNPAPDGERAIVVARGDLFSVPMKEGNARNLSKSSNAHERDAIWSPDGKWIAYNSDVTGENELYVRSQDGRGQPQQVTSGADTYYYRPVWSPDSKKLLWADRLQRLRYVDVNSKAVTQVDQDKWGEIQSYDWSPDSQWIAWARPEENDLPRVYIYSLADKKQTAVTDEWYGSGNVAFSDDGKYLLFASGRDFKPTFAEDEFENVYLDMQRVYLVTLAKDTESPLGPRSDEVGKAEQKRAKQKEKEGEEKKPEEKKSPSPTQKPSPTPTPELKPKKPVVVKVDLDGIHDRISGVEIVPGNYSDIRVVDDRIFYLRRTVADQEDEDEADQDSRDRKAHLCSYSLEDRKEIVLGDVNAYQISADGKRMLVKIKKDYAIIELPKDKLETKDHELKLAGLDMQLDKHAEWNQIYFECWRQMRDFFYAPNMNGIDWKAMRDKYAAILPFVNHRNDLTYLLGELIGELNNGHTYVGGGERPETPRIKLGLLGAELSRDPATKAYRVDRILPGQNWDKHTRSPLTAQGINVKVGDYILAINNTLASGLPNLYDGLIGTADKQVILRINSKPSDEGARDVTVVPTADDSPLYYLAWVQKNIDYVNKKTNDEVGYLHIPDMGRPGLNEFTKLSSPKFH